MKEILKRSYINKEKIFYILVILFFVLVISSYIYYVFYMPVIVIQIPTIKNDTIYLYFTGNDIVKMTINGILKNRNLYIVENDEKIDYYVMRMNKIIERNKDKYLFYYEKFSSLYPERYFYFCIQDRCSLYFFSFTGLVKVENYNNSNNLLYFWIEERYLEEIIRDLENNSTQLLLSRIKDGLINGNIKIKNSEKIVDRIIKEYSRNITLQ